MKRFLCAMTLLALAVAFTATTGMAGQAYAQSSSPAASDSGAPADIVPGSPLADVIKMLQAGVDAATIKTYILNCQNAFNLNADKIVYLRDMGASSDLINAMMDRDKALNGASLAPAPAPAPVPAFVPEPGGAPASEAIPAPDTSAIPDASVAPPPADVSVDSFNPTLTPYGTWLQVDGYGNCWRPTVALYNAAWSPYCNNGHWVYTDYGWYWDSDYAWGITFHYGRWFRDPRFGWCWLPDTVWAPSWVAWRSNGDYCGWAPLPPFAVFRPGVGFLYRGVAVGAGFDFGLKADFFVYVPSAHFCDRRPDSFCVPRERAAQLFHQTTLINHFDVRDRFVANRGFAPERIAAAMHRPVEPVRISSLANAGRQGWRGPGFDQPPRPAASPRFNGSNRAADTQFRPQGSRSGEIPRSPASSPPATVVTRVAPPNQFAKPARDPGMAGGESPAQPRQAGASEPPRPNYGQPQGAKGDQPVPGNAPGQGQPHNLGNGGANNGNRPNQNQPNR